MSKQDSHPHRSIKPGVSEMFFHFQEEKGVVYKLGRKEIAGGTVFFRQEKPGDVWIGAAAHCSARDQFCKERGRTVARRRYLQGDPDHFRFDKFEGEKPTYEVAKALYLKALEIDKE